MTMIFSDEDHLKLGRLEEYQEIFDRDIKLPLNNPPQHKAIVKALTHSVSLIQGPPGKSVLSHIPIFACQYLSVSLREMTYG